MAETAERCRLQPVPIFPTISLAKRCPLRPDDIRPATFERVAPAILESA
jgi:hypothetical protein